MSQDATAPPTRQWRKWGPWVIVVVLLVLLGIAADGAGGGAPLDPNGTGPEGAKALVLLLRHYGATVDLTAALPPPGIGSALVLDDELDGARRDALTAWVKAGGLLVVADPSSPLQLGAPASPDSGLTSSDLHPAGVCALPTLANVTTLDVGASLLLRPPPGAPIQTCFTYHLDDHETASFLLTAPFGAGKVVALGGAGLWTNARLDRADNATLAVDLLGRGTAILLPSEAGSGSKSELDLLSPRLKSALIQLLVAFVALAWWRGRRLGRPVEEPGVVQVAASEIVVAVGDLMTRTRNRDGAARQLRAGFRRAVGRQLGLGPRATAEDLADLISIRTSLPRERVHDLLADAPVADDNGLVLLAQSLAQLRQEVTGGHVPARP